MKLCDYIKIIFQNINRDKRNTYYIISLTFLTIFILFILSFKSNFQNYITTAITENVAARTLSIGINHGEEEKSYEQINNIDYIEYVYSSKYDFSSVDSSFKNDIYDGILELSLGNEHTIPKNIIGETITSSSSGVAICPAQFLPSSDSGELITNNSLLINGKDLLGTNFDVYYTSKKNIDGNIIDDKTFTKEFQIIGIYDSKSNFTLNNVCYISEKDMKEIKDTTLSVNGDISYGYFAIVDKTENVAATIETLENLGFDAESKITIDTDLFNNLSLVCNILIIIIVIFLIIIIIFYIKKKSLQDTKKIGLLRSIGYSKGNIFTLFVGEYLIINIISLIVGIILYLALYAIIMQLLIKPYLNIIFQISPYYINILYVSIVLVLVALVFGMIYTIIILQRNITKVLRSE